MNKAAENAVAYHLQGCNCAQSVLLAMKEHTGLSDQMAASLGAGFGGGAGCRELCGAISGAIMAAGIKFNGDRAQVNAVDRELTGTFREKFGALRCADLKAARISCDDLIAFAAEKMDGLLGSE